MVLIEQVQWDAQQCYLGLGLKGALIADRFQRKADANFMGASERASKLAAYDKRAVPVSC